jgi:hypothetical protein
VLAESPVSVEEMLLYVASETVPVELPYDVVVPHWKYAVADEPFGSTVPFIVPPLAVMFVAAVVVTVGSGVVVVKDTSDP